MVSWLDTLNPFMRLYAWLWHDVCGLDQPFSFYLEQWPWPLVFVLLSIVGLIVAWKYSRSNRRQWAVIVAAGVWCFLLGHLYFPAMN